MSNVRSTRRQPAPRSDTELLDVVEFLEVLQAIAAGEVTRAGGSIDPPHLWRGQQVDRLLLRRMASHELITTTLGGAPRLEPRGAELLRRAEGRRLLARFQLDPVYFRVNHEGRLVELAPAQCPAGHPLGPGRSTVGNDPCGMHRVYRSWRCGH